VTPQDAPGRSGSQAAQDSAPPTPQSRSRHAAPRQNHKRTPWTPEEDALLQEHYPQGGPEAVWAAGVNRTHGSIGYRAHILGTRTRRRNAWTPEEDQLLQHHYPHGGTEAVQAAGVERTNNAIQSRANKAGLTRITRDDSWTNHEDQLVRRHYPQGGAKAVLDAGVDRSEGAIQTRAYTLGVRTNRKPPEPKKTHRAKQPRLPPSQAEHLRRLAALNGELLDSDDANHTTLRALARKGLAKHLGAGLFKITLAGLVEHRQNTSH